MQQVLVCASSAGMTFDDFQTALADHDREVLDKAVERMYASAANDESDFRSLKAAVLGDNDETLVHYENCDRTFGCTCGTRTLAVRGEGE